MNARTPSGFSDLRALWAFARFSSGDAIELCAFEGDKPSVAVAYPANIEEALALASRADAKASVSGCYVVPTPLGERLASDSTRCDWRVGKGRAKDADVEWRRIIYIDVDCVRPRGQNATDLEKRQAEWIAQQVFEELGRRLPVGALAIGDSGNGAFVLVAIHPVRSTRELTGRIGRFLKTLAQRFDDEGAHIDLKVGNPSRLIPLPGTLKRKGPDSEERPHRRTRLTVPEVVEPVSVDVLLDDSVTGALVGAKGKQAPAVSSKPRVQIRTPSHSFAARIESLPKGRLLADLGLVSKGDRCACPSCGEPDALVGNAGVTCFHNRCAGVGKAVDAGGAFMDWTEVVSLVRRVPRQEAALWLLNAMGGDVGDSGDGSTAHAAPRPVVLLSPDEATVADTVITHLVGWGALFRRVGSLVEVSEAGQISTISPIRLRDELTRHVEFWKAGSKGELVRASPPELLASQILARPEWVGIRDLQTVVGHPVLERGGPGLVVSGYDATTGNLVVPDGLYPAAPESPTRDDAMSALRRLFDPFSEFPFAQTHHASAFLVLLLTLIVRPSLEGSCPIFLIDATTAGSGKSLLALAAGLIATGSPPALSVLPKGQEELRKRITAELLAGRRLIVFDNVTATLGGDALDASVTARTWTDRRLGESVMLEIPNRAVFIATGNNVVLGADTVRRTVTIRLEPQCESPENRDAFTHRDLLRYIETQRRQMVIDLLTVARAYLLAGAPALNIPAMGSFEAWSGLARSALVWCGWADPLAGMDEVRALQRADSESFRLFLEHWVEKFGEDQPVYAKRATSELDWSPNSPLGALLDGDKQPNQSPKRLAQVLSRHRGKVVGALRLVALPKTKLGVPWAVGRVRPQTASSLSPVSPPHSEEEGP